MVYTKLGIDLVAGQPQDIGVYLPVRIGVTMKKGDVNSLRLFRRPRLSNDPLTRRLQFIKTRYNRPKCACGRLAKYTRTNPRKDFWCNEHFPDELRQKLSLEHQMVAYILPLANYMDNKR